MRTILTDIATVIMVLIIGGLLLAAYIDYLS